jgi:general secretion pathway protein M
LSPFAFLEGLTTSTLGREKLAAINPIGQEERGDRTQETIELKLNGVSLQELVDLLYKIDVSGTAMRCTTLAIKKRYRDPYTYDVTLTAIALNAR